MITYPDSTLIVEKAHIIRHRTLPEDVMGEVLVKEGDNVTPQDVIAWGTHASDYVIVDVAGALGLDPDRYADRLDPILSGLKVGDKLAKGDTIGQTDKRGLQRRLPKAPANAIISLVEQGRVILQVNPRTVQVHARLAGTVLEIAKGFGATIEAYGSLLQCAWGNGQFATGRFEFEPGFRDSSSNLKSLADLIKLDVALSPYTGKVIILLRPLKAEDLLILSAHELAGLVAPCAPPHLREAAKRVTVPIILTEGFGNLPPTARLYDLLYERRTAQAIFDATPPDYRTQTRPEIILPGGVAPSEAQKPALETGLAIGMRVRLRRAPHQGRIGVIQDLPETPIQLENGLRVLCARVQLLTGDHVIVPQANVENLGEPLEA